jgi:hypothetical protein
MGPSLVRIPYVRMDNKTASNTSQTRAQEDYMYIVIDKEGKRTWKEKVDIIQFDKLTKQA